MNHKDIWEEAEAEVRRLQVICVALALATLALGGALAWVAVRGTPIHYVPPGGPGLSMPGVLPDVYAEDVASRFLQFRYTYTPATVREVLWQAEVMLHPSLSVPFLEHAEKEITQAKSHQMSVQTTTLSAEVVSREKHMVTVVLSGRQSIYIGGLATREEPIRAEIVVQLWSGHGRMGALISKALIDPALTVTGEKGRRR